MVGLVVLSCCSTGVEVRQDTGRPLCFDKSVDYRGHRSVDLILLRNPGSLDQSRTGDEASTGGMHCLLCTTVISTGSSRMSKKQRMNRTKGRDKKTLQVCVPRSDSSIGKEHRCRLPPAPELWWLCHIIENRSSALGWLIIRHLRPTAEMDSQHDKKTMHEPNHAVFTSPIGKTRQQYPAQRPVLALLGLFVCYEAPNTMAG